MLNDPRQRTGGSVLSGEQNSDDVVGDLIGGERFAVVVPEVEKMV